jgi:AMP phosphorylase
MQLKVQPLDIKVGKFKVVLNTIDAKELGVNEGDRVYVKDHENLTAIVDTTEDMIAPGMIGVYHEVAERLQRAWTEPVEVMPATRPKSTEVIKKMMDQEKLTEDEIYLFLLLQQTD